MLNNKNQNGDVDNIWKKCSYKECIDKLSELSNEFNTISVIRHADREHILKPDEADKAMLTEEGKKKAESYGKNLSKINNIDFYHSPVHRCKQTVNHICQGYNGHSNIKGVNKFSGCPYILDSKEFNEKIFELGGRTFINEWVDGNISSLIIKPWDIAISDMLKGLKKNHSSDAKVTDLHVTHDINISLFLNAIKDLTGIDYEWPGYLEMIIISYDEKGTYIHGRGDKKKVQIGGLE